MTPIAPTIIKVAGQVMEFHDGHVTRIGFGRGVAWNIAEFVVADGRTADKALKGKRNPVTITVETAANDVVTPTTIGLTNWHIVERLPMEDGKVKYILVDDRWRLSYAKLTAQYNIVSYGGKYRADSVRGGVAWKCLDAAIDALTKLGANVVVDPDLPLAARTIDLPDNLGNADGGGFVGAPMGLFLPLMLEPIRCDIVTNDKGEIVITDRVTEHHAGLDKFIHMGGDVGQADNIWQRPSQIVVPFQRRVEKKFTYSHDPRATASTDPLTPQLENVIPEWDGTKPPERLTEIFKYVNQGFGRVLRMTLQAAMLIWTRKQWFNIHDYTTAQELDQALEVESLIRMSFRRWFRVVTKSGDTDDVRARFADIRLGRLAPDGTTRPDGGVFCDYTMDRRYGVLKNEGDHPLTAKFTTGVPFDANKPAPFRAAWLAGQREELAFGIDPIPADRRSVREYMVGRYDRERQYTDFHAAVRGTADFVLDSGNGLRDDFTMVVYWNGLWTGHLGGTRDRDYKHRVPGFADGLVPELTVSLVHDMTANYADMQFPSQRPMNHADLDARAKEIAADVMESYERGEAGYSRHGGIDVLKKGQKWPRGNIHDVAIIIGGRGRGSVDTLINILPGMKPKAQPVFTGPRPQGSESARIL